ncbi:arylamine N-acetyltransferase [Paraburkholderia solisilvae]|nr:arylamine N-acetyltransferase [Paraburkholderia solisilvae]
MPFENLNPVIGRPVSLAMPALADTSVARHRGAYAFGIDAGEIDIAAVFERIKGRVSSGLTP